MWRLAAVAAVAALGGCGRLGFDSLRTDDTDALDPTGDGGTTNGWADLVAGDQTTCGIYRDRAYCWGRGTNDEIGDGVAMNRAVPTEVALPIAKVTAISQGEQHGCAILDGTTAYCWGSVPPGTGPPNSSIPIPVTTLPSPVTSIACGGGFTCAVAAGAAYCWGSDNAGSLGNGAGGASTTPNLVTLPATAVAVDAGNDHALALLADGSVYAWGHNDSGALGTGSMTPNQSQTAVVTVITDALPAIAGWHSCVAKAGAVQCWGLGTMGELGDGMSTSNATPVDVIGMNAGVTAMMTGGGPTDKDVTCATNANIASCWGAGVWGRLGQGSVADSPVPIAVQQLPTSPVVQFGVGYSHTCSRHADGRVFCWGRGDSGQLGDGSSANSMIPVEVPQP